MEGSRTPSEQAGGLPSQTPETVAGSDPREIPGQTPGGTPLNPPKHKPRTKEEELGRTQSVYAQQTRSADPRETQGEAADDAQGAIIENGVCAACGRSQEEWVYGNGRGIKVEGQFYCSPECAERAPLSLEEPAKIPSSRNW